VAEGGAWVGVEGGRADVGLLCLGVVGGTDEGGVLVGGLADGGAEVVTGMVSVVSPASAR
jgi:hypothetical protein